MAGQGFKIADGYLDIEADTDGALADVRAFFKEVDGELAAEEKAFARSGKESGTKYATGVATAIDSRMRGLRPMRSVLKDMDHEALIAAHDIGEHITSSIYRSVTGSSRRRGGLLGRLIGGGERALGGLGSLLSRGLSGASKLFSSITQGITTAVSTGVDTAKQIWEGASKAFSTIGSIGSGIGQGAIFAAYALGIPIVIGLAGALSQLAAVVLTLPAAFGVAAAAIAPLIIAFHGFGEAVSAGWSGDKGKFNEALKSLAPNARKVAKEVVGLKAAFSGLQQSVQNAFFGPLVGQVSKLGGTLIPALKNGLTLVAGVLGQVAAGFVQLLSAPGTITILNNLFATTARIMAVFGPQLVNVFGAFLNLLNAGLPWIERFNAVLSGGLKNVADWINNAVAPGGKFTGWMEKAWDVGKKLWDVIKGLGEYIGTLLSSFSDEGTDTLRGMGDAIKRMNDFLKTKDGQEALHNLGVLIHWAGNAFVFLMDHSSDAWKALNGLFSFIRGIGPFFSNLWSSIVDGVKAVGNWFVWLGSTIWGGIKSAWDAVVGFGKTIWDALTTAYNAVVSAGGAVIDWFTALPGEILGFIESIPDILVNSFTTLVDAALYGIGYLGGLLYNFFLVTFPGWIQSSWDWVTSTVSTAITTLVNYIAALPGTVWGYLTQFGSFVMDTISSAWEWAKNATLSAADAIWGWVSALPGRIGSALSSLGSAIGGWFSSAWDKAKNATIDGYHSVMQWIRDLPGAIKDALSGAVSWLYDSGKDIIHGLVNGLEDALSWAVDKAREAASRIKKGFEDALGISSPSRVMRVEVGRWILPGVMQGIEDTKPQFGRYLGATADMINGTMAPTVNVAAPSVSVGGTTLIADLGDGIRQAVPLQIMRNPTTVATAANVGNRGRAAWTNTGRTVITSAS